MECRECGADIEAGSKFCDRCAAPVAGAGARQVGCDEDDPLEDPQDQDEDDDEDREDEGEEEGEEEPVAHPRAEASAPSGAQGRGAGAIGLGLGLVAMIVLGVLRLTNRPTVRIEAIDPPDLGASVAVATPPAVLRDAPAERTASESERALTGTWVARVGFDAPRPASVGSTLVQIEALRAGLVAPLDRCVWLELYPNLRGFQHECGVIDGEPSVLERAAVGGSPRALGVGFRWSFEGGRISITYDEAMTVTAAGRTARFVETVLTLPAGSPPFDVSQSFPEHPDTPPLTARFEVFAGRYLGDVAEEGSAAP